MSVSLCMCASTCAFVFCFENTNIALADTNKLTHTAVLSESRQWMLRQWSLFTSPKMHSVPVLMLEQGQRLDHYPNLQLPGLSPLWHRPSPAPASQNVTIGGLSHTTHDSRWKMEMLVSLLAWVSNTHTEQEESWNDSSSHSLLAACQLEAIAGKGSHRQTPLLKAEAVTAQCSQEATFEKEVRDGFIPSYI